MKLLKSIPFITTRVLPAYALMLPALAVSCLAQTGDLPARLDLVATAYHENRSFTGTVLVAQGGRIVLKKGYGSANLEWDIPNAPDTRFRIGSMTKQFTSAGIMLLSEQKQLSVDDAACKYFDGCPDAWKSVTVHHLLTHTSGIPSYTDEPGADKPQLMRVPLSPSELLLRSKDKPLEFASGTQWKYSNSGYVFLGAIIEKVSGEKYADFMQKHIFNPLGMKDTGYDQTEVVLKRRASGYQPCGESLCNSDYIDMSLPFAAGALYSSVDDLYRWDRALRDNTLLMAASRERMFTPVLHDYGYGWMVGRMGNHAQMGHGGYIPGFSSYIARFPAEDVTVIVLSNNISASAQAICESLAATVFGEKTDLPHAKKQVTINSEILGRYAGTWQVGPMRLAVTDEAGHLPHFRGGCVDS